MSNRGSGDYEDGAGLKEKYLHSQGAALYDEGLYDEALAMFKEAVALEDQPYTRYHLCLTYIAKKDNKNALREIDRAIELNPSVAKYYHRRSELWQSLGNTEEARKDRERARKLDENYAHIEEIRSAYRTIEEAFTNSEMREWCSAVQVKHAGLRRLIGELKKSLDTSWEAIETASCALPCPAYCCHFEGETVRHGVHIGAWKLQAIRSFLKARNMLESDAIGRLPFCGEEHLARLIPPHHILRERGERFIYYPKRSTKPLGRSALKGLPKGKDYQELLWINETSRACAFLKGSRCMIHDLGDEPGLPACKEFLCMTGFVFAVLNHLELIKPSQLRIYTMTELNRVAVEGLLLMGRTLYDEHLMRLRNKAWQKLKTAAEADSGGLSAEIDRCIRSHRRLKKQYEALFEAQRKEAPKAIRAVMKIHANTKAKVKERGNW